ncbi:MAG: right-handed parallel beta-helix repeat-containing protein [Verrucomicrobia bacterium]|nr:right-handed parallel beta-helix repeat-containing protein [Verrucomicrobiota bacterium]
MERIAVLRCGIVSFIASCVCAGMIFGAPSAHATDPTDLDVPLIERTPRYDYDATKNDPAPGDTVTFHGHVKLWGTSGLSSVAYRWELDGEELSSGTMTNLAAGEERVLTQTWTWQSDRHTVKLIVDPANAIAERSETNNSVEDYTDGIIVGFWVEQSVYDYFHQYQNELGDGANSWQDWAQRQIRKWNSMCPVAVWDISPDGVLDRFRLDKIVVVADGALPLNGGLATNHPDLSDRTVDLMWGFPATLLGGSMYSNHTSTSETNAFYIEQSLLHELGHARYLIDSYGFDTHNTSSHHSVQIYEGSTYVAGSSYMPFLAWGEVLYYNKSGGVMSGPYGFNWSPYEAGALNLIAGLRASEGNYNSPGNIGVFLQDLPQNNHLRIIDHHLRPRAGANVRIYNAVSGPGWYGKTFDNTYDQEYTADANGYINLPRNPFNPGGTITHTYGLANGVMILRISHNGQIWYRFVEVSDFNIEYWKGNTQHAYYTETFEGIEGPDLDGDGLPDEWEMIWFGDMTHGPAGDDDTGGADGLTNLEEYQHGTDPANPDTDGDGLLDGTEVHTHGTDPLDPDSDGDTMFDGFEVDNGFAPLDFTDGSRDRDGDRLLNAEESAWGSDPLDAASPSVLWVDDDNAGDPAQDGSFAHPYSSVQTAITAAVPPAIVRVLPGYYTEQVSPLSSVWLIGSGAESTTIDSQDTRETILADGVSNVVVADFALTSGGAGYTALRSIFSTMTVRNCVATGSASGFGVGQTGALTVASCVAYDNALRGIWQSGEASLTVVNTTIVNNGQNGLVRWGTGTVTIVGTVISGSDDDVSGSSIAAAYCNIGDGTFAGSNGNISADPLFVDPVAGDFRLLPGSPCIDAGTSTFDGAPAGPGKPAGIVPTTDLERFARWDDPATINTGGGNHTYYDIGAYEYCPDTDADGLPDSTETDTGTYGGYDNVGTDPNNPDTDGDTSIDGDEIAAGTDPFDPASLFKVTDTTLDEPARTACEITWTVEPLRKYKLLWSPSLSPPSWDQVSGTALNDLVDNGDGTWTWTDTGADPEMGGVTPGITMERFYRVLVE